jgi:protein-L-isoaspartate O-methyltransferase
VIARVAGSMLIAVALLARAEDAGQFPPFITTPADVVERMLSFAGTGPADTVIDLGSGDGRIVITAAQKFGARGLGIELDKRLVAISRENARRANVADRVSFVEGDVLETDISKATVVTVYLLPSLLERLQPRFVDELRPGTRIVSHAFPMAGWKPDRTDTMQVAQSHPGQGDESTLFLWVVPVDARGEWRGGGWQLRINQNYQEIEIEATLEGEAFAVRKARLSGRDIAWDAEGMRFRGRIEGARITGVLTDAGTGRALELVRSR